MATYTSIPAFTSGQVLTSAVMNDVKNNLDLGNAQSAYPYRNMLYNGAMQVAQRGTSVASISAAGTTYNTADRWALIINNTAGTWTQSVETADAPSGSGLRQSLKMLCTSANAALDANDLIVIQQPLEGYDVQRIRKGTASAQPLTLSFWVKSNVTGTYVAELRDDDNNRQVSATYTISASATWEQKTITFPADTTGTLNNDNGASLILRFGLCAGSTFSSGTLNTAWATQTEANRYPGQANVSAATNNYWQITGVQLEAGSVSTPFEFLPYETDLAKCQRYYFRMSGSPLFRRYGSGANMTASVSETVVHFPVAMRTGPTTLDTSGTASHYGFVSQNVGIACTVVPTLSYGTSETAILSSTNATVTAGNAGALYSNNTSGYLGFSAEL